MGHYTKEKWIETSPSSTLNLPESGFFQYVLFCWNSWGFRPWDDHIHLGENNRNRPLGWYPVPGSHGPEDLSKTI